MIAIIWTYKVRPEHRPAFEATYGPDGDWARLFAHQDGYLGTELLRGEDESYLTIDRWRTQADFDAFLAAHRADYEALDRATERWTVEEVRVGIWEGGFQRDHLRVPNAE